MELIVALAVAGIAGVFVAVNGRRAPVCTTRRVPSSPTDEAERILASRYARGRITAEEYDRMAAVLRR